MSALPYHMLENKNITVSFNDGYFNHSENLRILSVLLGSLNIVANGCFLILLIISRKSVNWKRYALVANLTVSDFLVNLLFVSLVFTRRSNTIKSILRNLMTFTFKVNLLSYFGTIVIQYFAVKQPLQYKTVLNLYKIKICVCVIWCFVFMYIVLIALLSNTIEAFNIVCSIFDLTFQGLITLLNTVFYLYIVYISLKKKRQKLDSAAVKQLNKKIAVRNNLRSNFYPNIDETRTFVKECKFLITIGISLLIYWICMLPLWIYWVAMEIINEPYYFSVTIWKQRWLLIWFSRCFFDPLLYIYREPKLIKKFKSLIVC